MKGFDVTQIIISQPVREAVDRAKNVGRLLASIEALLLAFVCWYRVHTGAPWLTIAKDWFLGILVCAFILLTVGTSAGLEQWIWQVGVYLGELFNPAQGFLMENFDKAVGRHAQQILEIQAGAVPEHARGGFAGGRSYRLAVLEPLCRGLVGVNAIGIYLMKMVMQVSYAWLISFYWMLTPLMAPMVILPQTRNVFLGWLRDVRRRGSLADVLRIRGAAGARDPLERLDRRRRRNVTDIWELIANVAPGRNDAADLQHHVLLRVPVDPYRELPDRLRRIPTVPQCSKEACDTAGSVTRWCDLGLCRVIRSTCRSNLSRSTGFRRTGRRPGYPSGFGVSRHDQGGEQLRRMRLLLGYLQHLRPHHSEACA